MSQLLRGPLVALGLYLLLVAVVFIGMPTPVALSGAFLGSGAADALSSDSLDVAWFILGLVSLATSACLLYLLLFRAMGNRVAALASGALLVAHPVMVSVAESGAAAPALLPPILVLAALALRSTPRRGARPGKVWEAPLFAAMAILTGPMGAPAVVLGFVLFEGSFSHRAGTARAGRPFWIPVLVAITWWAIVPAFSERWHHLAPLESAGSVLAALLFIPAEASEALPWIAVGVFLVGVITLVIGLKDRPHRPRWLLIHVGFALTWMTVAGASAVSMPGSDLGPAIVLASLGPAIALPALVWRGLVALWPEPLEERFAPPPAVPDLAVGTGPALQTGAPERPEPAFTLPELRAVVSEAVRETLAAPAGHVARERPAREPDPAAALLSVAGDRAASKRLLGAAWPAVDEVRNLFRNFLLPHLARDFRVLEIGPAGGAFTALVAPRVAEVVCVETSVPALQDVRRLLRSHGNVHYVAGDREALGPLRSASFDLAWSFDAFVHLDQEEIYLWLRDLARVLRPGARAVLAFANLIDPVGLARFREEVGRRERTRGTGDRINFLSPEVVRTLVGAAGLGTESLHLATHDRDLVAVLQRSP